jgi:hypothetical protein
MIWRLRWACEQMAKKFGKFYEGLPNDLINFPHNPLACAVALGCWDFKHSVEI